MDLNIEPYIPHQAVLYEYNNKILVEFLSLKMMTFYLPEMSYM